MTEKIFVTEYKGITTALYVPASNIYSFESNEIDIKEFEKYIGTQQLKHINCERKPIDKIIGMSIGCADTCNLACSYCYANAGTYNNSDRKIMNLDDYNGLLYYLKKYNYPILNITFFGGEPLLSYEGIKFFVPKLIQEYKSKFQTVPQFSIITNGTLINEEIIEFFNQHFSAVTISIDGPESMCDMTRISIDPKVSVFKKIEAAMDQINKISKRNFHLRAVATLTPELLKEIDKFGVIEYRESFYKMGFDSVAFFQATGIDWNEYDLNQLKIFYKQIINNTFDNLVIGNRKHLDDMTMTYLVDILKQHYNGDCVAGKNYLYYSSNGDIYPCQMYYNERKSNVEALKRYKLDKCLRCPVINVCQSFCAGTSLGNNKSENIPIDYLCEVERARFEYVIQRYGYEVYYNKNKKEYKVLIDTIKNYSKLNSVTKLYGEI